MGRKYTDNALTTLASNISSGATTLSVQAGKGDLFPVVLGHGAPGSTPDYFVITVENPSLQREKMRVEQRASGQDILGSAGFPLVRGYDGTAAQAWTAGDLVDLRMERSGAQDVEDKAQAADIAFGVKGSITAGLVFGFYGGVILNDGVVSVVADNSVALTASQTNFIERTIAGVVSANTAGFSADNIPMYEAVTDGSGITTITDRRSGILYRGRLSKSVAGGSNVTLNAAEARAEIIELTGVLTASIEVILPAIKRSWIVKNSTTGAFIVTVKTAAGTGIVVPQSKTSILYGDGVNILDAINAYRHAGLISKSVAGGTDVVLTDAEALTGIINLTGLLTANINVVVPTAARDWIIKNSTTGAFSLTVKTAAGTGIMLPQGGVTTALYCDGTNVLEGVSDYRYAGRLSRSVAGAADIPLSAAESRVGIFEFTGVLTGNINVIVPTAARDWIIKNGTTGAFTLTVKTAAGAGKAVAQGKTTLLHGDGTNVVDAITGLPTLDVAGALVANGAGNVIAPSFESGELAVPQGAQVAVAHGLGTRPRMVHAVLRSITGDRGYVAGDEVNLQGLSDDDGAGNPTFAVSVYADATNVSVVMGTGRPHLANRDGSGGFGAPFAIANAGWRIVLRAWK